VHTSCIPRETFRQVLLNLLLEILAELLPPDDLSRAVRLAASVLRALPSDSQVMSLAAKVYGTCLSTFPPWLVHLTSAPSANLAALGGLLMVDSVDVQLKTTIEWLQGKKAYGRAPRPSGYQAHVGQASASRLDDMLLSSAFESWPLPFQT
jgi:hypothetical protein